MPGRSQRKRKPRPKQTTYTINISPTETRDLVIRGRKKPRKLKLAIVNSFNNLVKQGLFSGLQFDEKGRFTGVEKRNREPTKEELSILLEVIELTQERLYREEMFSPD